MAFERKTRQHRALTAIPRAVKHKIEMIPENYPKPHFLPTLLDVVFCRMKYGSGVDDYFDFRFYSLNHIGRGSFGTVRDQFKLYYANDKDYIIRTANKNEFVKYYGHLMGRKTMSISCETNEDSFREFLEEAKESGFQRIIFKPYRGNSGRGVFILDLDDSAIKSVKTVLARYNSEINGLLQDVPQLQKELEEQQELVAEWVLENHADLKQMHPSSLNTLRMPTLRDGDSCKVMGGYFRIGRDGKSVDNISSGGMVAEVDLETGIVISPAVDHAGREYYKHPTTDKIIIGLQIPYWEEAKALVLKAAEITPQLKYTSWDVAITPTGPILIEGNSMGGLEIQQMPRHMGKRYLYENVLEKVK